MIQGRETSRTGGPDLSAAPARQLPYAIELWNLPRTAPERIIARAATVSLARVIFHAAQNENLGRRIVLRRGLEVLMESN
jgi:hypothetical protein